jgi:uncharacterized repeat protein (TIGR03803 family)
LAALLCLNVSAQTFTVLHAFTGSTDGGYPSATLTLDRAGNLYGTTEYGGTHQTGTVFKLTNKSGWLLTELYNFTGGNDGGNPLSSVIFGPDGSLYGNASEGGPLGYGTVYNLKPQPQPCGSVGCQWRETTLYQFSDPSDGEAYPWGNLHFDAAGNIYGTTTAEGGAVYELAPAAHGWTYQLAYAFDILGGPSRPYAGVISDAAGNLFGTTSAGGVPNCGRMLDCGTVFELSPAGSSWVLTVLHEFDGTDGGIPIGGLIADSLGNLYGANSTGYIYMLTKAGGGFSFQTLARVQGTCAAFLFGPSCGPWDTLTMGPDGSLYGSAYATGAFGYGSIFRLTPSPGGWVYTVLHDFTNGSDGAYPIAGVTLDSHGNFYGTTTIGGSGGDGVAFEITP